MGVINFLPLKRGGGIFNTGFQFSSTVGGLYYGSHDKGNRIDIHEHNQTWKIFFSQGKTRNNWVNKINCHILMYCPSLPFFFRGL